MILLQGNQKSNVIGEVLIDFAEYAELIKPLSVSLPLKNPQCATVLHVCILFACYCLLVLSYDDCLNIVLNNGVDSLA